ncbi:MAG: potassium transporter TrkG [Microbacteriaceae bacterium]
MAKRPKKLKAPINFWKRLRGFVDTTAENKPARFAIIIFSGLILLWAIILSLPVSQADGQFTGWVDALFTAVSVICVTGLSTVDMAQHWSGFGQTMIFIGVQIGAMGVMTLASMLGLVFSRKLGLRSRLMAAGDTNISRIHRGPVSEAQAVRLGEIGGLVLIVVVSTLILEFIIAMLMLPSMLLAGLETWDAIWHSFYYSVMAFTNTGFAPNIEGLDLFIDNYWFLSIMMLGVFLGSLGFPVFYALIRQFGNRRHWSLHVKLTLIMVVGLFILGGLLFSLLELGNSRSFASDESGEYFFNAFFMSMMTRSGGFALIDPNTMTGSSLLAADMLMFVGGGSASTAGGIKVTTLAVLFLAIWAEARGKSDLEAFGRRIPPDVLRIAVSVLLLSATTIAISCMSLLAITGDSLDHILFDVISAFGTVGLSTGFTETVPDLGKLVLIGTMWMGRIGTVTLAVAISASTRHQMFRRPEERPIVG